MLQGRQHWLYETIVSINGFFFVEQLEGQPCFLCNAWFVKGQRDFM